MTLWPTWSQRCAHTGAGRLSVELVNRGRVFSVRRQVSLPFNSTPRDATPPPKLHARRLELALPKPISSGPRSPQGRSDTFPPVRRWARRSVRSRLRLKECCRSRTKLTMPAVIAFQSGRPSSSRSIATRIIRKSVTAQPTVTAPRTARLKRRTGSKEISPPPCSINRMKRTGPLVASTPPPAKTRPNAPSERQKMKNHKRQKPDIAISPFQLRRRANMRRRLAVLQAAPDC